MIFQAMLGGLSQYAGLVSALFSRNLMICLMNQAAKEDRYLHRAAVKALKAIEGAAAQNPSAIVPIVKALTGSNGAYGFDQRTKSKTMEKVLQHTRPEDGPEVLAALEGNLNKAEG
jgi:DNA polymerase phi